MPRVRDLLDYSSDESFKNRKPRETLIEVPMTDSVQVITIHLQPSSFVQIVRVIDENGKHDGWKVATNINTVINREGGI
jgi:hypothetical protein